MSKKFERVESAAALKSICDKLPIEVESENIAKFLPDDLYKSVAKILGLDENIKEKLAQAKRKEYKKLFKGVQFLSRALNTVALDKEPSEELYDSETPVEPPSPRIITRLPCINPYYDFLQKTEREQVRWTSKYLPPETEKEKGLVKRADDITNQICADFCEYMHNLGGYISPLFQQDTVKQLFQIEFNTHTAKSLTIDPKQLVSIPSELAAFKKVPELSRKNTLKSNIKWDVNAENKSAIQTAFNRQLPKERQRRPPRNMTKKSWKPEDYPKRIVSMENVWDGITNLKSVQDYCKWINDHPKAGKPKYLKKRNMFDMKKLHKMSHQHQYDADNQPTKIDLKELLCFEKERKLSPLPKDLKIVYD